MQAADVPMAVPEICKKFISPNSKWLYFMARVMAWMTARRGKEEGNDGSCEIRKSQLVSTASACSVSMLVYMD